MSAASDAAPGINGHLGIWFFIRLSIALVLLRFARSIAESLCHPYRAVTSLLSEADNYWLSLAVRTFGIWLFIRAAGYFFRGVILAASPPKFAVTQYTDRYFMTWGLVYFLSGWVLAKRPDVIGLGILGPSKNRIPPNKLPLPTPDSGTPAADVPVAPPPGATGR
jgi:hypothetical protein